MDSSKKSIYIIAALAFIFIILAIYFLFIHQKAAEDIKPDQKQAVVKEISQIELAKRPYITLTPTSDGAEIIISIEKMTDFDKIEYELTYLADNPQIAGEKIQRGATGSDVNPKDQKYKKSILLGTASRGVRSPDKGIADGKLTLHLFKADIEYQSETIWDLFEVGPKSQTLKTHDGNLQLTLPPLIRPYWFILADTVGFPPGNESLDPQKVVLPIFGVFSVAPPLDKPGSIKIKLQNFSQDLLVRTYLHQDAKWDETLTPSFDKNSQTLIANIKNLATFVVSSK